MKITSFNPLIVSKDAAPTIALFEALGFEVHHHRSGVDALSGRCLLHTLAVDGGKIVAHAEHREACVLPCLAFLSR